MSDTKEKAAPLEVRDLNVAYQTKVVVWDADFDAPPGRLVAIVGPNGAGKSTLIKAALGLVPAASGSIRFFGLPYREARHRVAYVPQRESVDWDFPVSAVDVVAYTRGPGLAGALLVGAGTACALAASLGKPTLGVHHLEGHLLSPFLSENPPAFPFVALLVSGGHTQLMQVNGVGRYALLGESIDDAAGEAFDKSAQLLGLGYPGGPALAALAEQGNPAAYALPRPLLNHPNLDFSFAGLKTAVMTQCQRLGTQLAVHRADVAASTQAAIVEVLVKKSLRALDETGLRCLVVAGGVGANASLRTQLQNACQAIRAKVFFPELSLCTDNGAMIAFAGALRLKKHPELAQKNWAFDVRPRWPLDQLD